jgi:hypothetical protein
MNIQSLMHKLFCPIVPCKPCKSTFRNIGNLHPLIKSRIRSKAGSCDPWNKSWPYKKDYKHGPGTIQSNFGCVIHCGGSQDYVLSQINKAKELGCKTIRITLYAENYNDQYLNWLEYILRSVSHCMNIIIVLSMSEKGLPLLYPDINSPEYIPVFCDYLERINNNFGNYKNSLIPQVLNEVNTKNFYNITPQRYMEILKAAYKFFKDRNWPFVLTSGLVGAEKPDGPIKDYLSQLISNGLKENVDGFAFHWYMGDEEEYTWALSEDIAYLRSSIGEKPIYITEFGSSNQSSQPAAFEHLYKTFGKEYGLDTMIWYCMLGDGEFALLNNDLSNRPIFDYIKNHL